MRTIEQVTSELEAKRKALDNFELDPDDFTDEYDEMLREIEGEIKVCGISFDADRILKELDPTAYRCGLLDYIDNMDITDTEGYKALEGEIEELEDELADLEEQVEEENDELSGT
jgi:predicted  nucleic acid-binding Zn-ribbon protein